MQANEAIRGHHRDLIATLDGHVSALAARREDVDPAALVEFLKGDLLPHARGEERHLYPAVDKLLREHGRATATMSLARIGSSNRIRRSLWPAVTNSGVPSRNAL